MKEEVKKIAIDMAKKKGLVNLTRKSVSEAAGIKDGSWSANVGCTFTELIEEIQPLCPNIVAGQGTEKTRLSPKMRVEHLISVALDLCEKDGYTNVNRESIAKAANVSVSLITHYLGTMKNLRRDMMRHAIKQERLNVIAQGLTLKDPHALKAPPELQEKARKSLNN